MFLCSNSAFNGKLNRLAENRSKWTKPFPKKVSFTDALKNSGQKRDYYLKIVGGNLIPIYCCRFYIEIGLPWNCVCLLFRHSAPKCGFNYLPTYTIFRETVYLVLEFRFCFFFRTKEPKLANTMYSGYKKQYYQRKILCYYDEIYIQSISLHHLSFMPRYCKKRKNDSVFKF